MWPRDDDDEEDYYSHTKVHIKHGHDQEILEMQKKTRFSNQNPLLYYSSDLTLCFSLCPCFSSHVHPVSDYNDRLRQYCAKVVVSDNDNNDFNGYW